MPTGSIVSKLWFVRITLPHVAIKTLLDANSISFLDHRRFMVVSHVGERTEKEHVHCLVELSEPLQKQTVDKRYKRIFGVSGADYASKPWDGGMDAGAGSYLFHDPTAEIIKQIGFSQSEIDGFKSANEQVRKVVEVNKQRASGRCVERILKVIEESDRTWTRREIAARLITDIREGVMYEPGDYVLRRYIEEIYAKQLKGDDWNKYVDLRVNTLVRMEDAEITYAL